MLTSNFSPRRRSTTLLVLFATTELLVASCQDAGPFGMTEAAFARALAEKDSATILALPASRLDRPGSGGPATYFYTARWLEILVSAADARSGSTKALPSEDSQSPESPGRESGLAAPGKAAADGAEQDGPPVEIPQALSGMGSGTKPSVDVSGPRARIRELYSKAFETCTGYLQREAGLSLVAATAEDARRASLGARNEEAAGLWLLLLEHTQNIGDRLGPIAQVRRARLDALDALGRDAELVRECAQFRSLFAERTSGDDGLLYYVGSAAKRLGMKEWAPSLRAILFDRPVSPWTRRTLGFLSSSLPQDGSGEITQTELDAAAMRIAVADRDYGKAWHLALKARSLVFSPTCPEALVADAGKACLYSGSSKEGLELFAANFGAWPAEGKVKPHKGEERETAWTSAFYRARFLRALERWDEAASLFFLLPPLAPSTEDADAALWYGADASMKSAKLAIGKPVKGKAPSPEVLKGRNAAYRQFQLKTLEKISWDWSQAAVFNDLADSLLRDAIAAKDWNLVTDFAAKLGPRLSPLLDARSTYIAGRAAELKLGGKVAVAGKTPTMKGAPATAVPNPVPADGSSEIDGPTLPREAAAFFLASSSRSGAPTYYRILAHRRLGIDPELIPAKAEAPPGAMAADGSGGKADPEKESPSETEEFLLGFLDFSLQDQVFPEAKARFSELDVPALRRLADALAAHGDYASSMRMALALGEKKEWKADYRDLERIYPRPFLAEVQGLKPRPELPEYILYGLVRSESFFRPQIVSGAGAVGLAQLMPATAAEIAKAIGLKNYDLTLPADNLRLGAIHFAQLLDRTGNHPLLAMFAYNAGGARLKRWQAENAGLSDDLFLEALSFEETRQYGRNILQAAFFYGALYYGMDWKATVDGVMGPAAPGAN